MAGGRFAPDSVRVLEPSPPAVTIAPWFADDPLEGGTLVPVERPGCTSWQQFCVDRGDTALVTFCLERWLGPHRRLETLPEAFQGTRTALHAVAEHVLSPLRQRATGKIGLRWTVGGFGTPFFSWAGEDRQVRIERGDLVDGDRRSGLTTLGEAAAFVEVPLGAPAGVYAATTGCEPDAPLGVQRDAAAALGDWFGFATSLLEQVRADASIASTPGRVQLWPEHFDVAVAIGAAGAETTFGGSAGDDAHPEPYLYVSPSRPMRGVFWNEPFGASLPYSTLVASRDQRHTGLTFFKTAIGLLR